ncbi:thiamine-phosphate synthase family protein [Haloarchaeobius sp. HME9146]|uniref:thiamine-phosphate synthase family protein n=1 Tax=Haloarchaeobius sp. HME9146 TaxID=2978732 RepID=UPI0021BE86D4|nr:thiamine-phosphate synthase family protein [Haloarchaeobius sp. HME9146]MCT9095707.1 helix-turn-helix domain-containing protein [Haloarchaeobius sp. HME9146]
MRFIEEIVVEEFLPTFRSMLAADLRDRGFTQSEVAEALGISQSAVSKYAHGDVGQREEFLEDERVQELVERVGEGLADGTMTPVQGLVETEVLIRKLERGDLLATIHQREMPELAEYGSEFDIHDSDSEFRTAERVLSSLRRGLRVLENASGFAGLIPNVGSNLVACTPDATSIDDVAGVPGRIVDIKGRATVPSEPEFGVSEYVASVLLAAREAGAEVNAAANIRYDAELLARLEELGHETAEFESEDGVDASVAAALADDPTATVLYQTGSYGIEPIIYILGDDAVAVAETVRELV